MKNTPRRIKTNFLSILLISVICLGGAACEPNNNQTFLSTQTSTPKNNEIITVHYNERPPYLITTSSGLGGLTGAPASLVFGKSNIQVVWKQTPSKRQTYLLKQNSGRDCLVGWFKTADRELYARYTLPIYKDGPQFALARADNDKISSGHTVAEVFSNHQLNLLVKDGYSYGNLLDQKIGQYNPTRTVTTVENSGMLEMIFLKHADYFFIAPEEADGLIMTSKFDPQAFKEVYFTDITEGEKRYILCSKQVEEPVIDLLNDIIRQYVNQPVK